MPPKVRFSREEIRDTAYDIVREHGAVSLTARSLADRMGVSTSPIFTAFSNMDDVLASVRDLAVGEMDQKISLSVWMSQSFKGLGLSLLDFARNERDLFSVIFTGDVSLSEKLSLTKDQAIRLVMADEGLSETEADFVFSHFLVFILGLCFIDPAGKTVHWEDMLDSEYRSLISCVKQHKAANTPPSGYGASHTNIGWEESG